MLDGVRYLIVWNPVIFLLLNVFLYAVGYIPGYSHQGGEAVDHF